MARKKEYEIDTKETETFINPYNFIPLEEKCDRKYNYEDIKKQNKLTGWIECSLQTLTHIFIPNTTNN
ncbi:MAG: hypothetical protein ABRQ38_18550, partial [Candidatus Eremiobacterota bacterium]